MQHFKVLQKWADYLVKNGLDPASQLQTDDFSGPIKSSANLALKAVVGVGAMSKIAEAVGNDAEVGRYRGTAKSMAGEWVKRAQSKQGNHLTLAYAQDPTWSLKYNAFADRVLGLDLIPPSITHEEGLFYAARANPYGIPLDNRNTYTKTDWEFWTAAATDNPDVRRLIIDDVFRFVNESPSRVAFSDWYDTVTGKRIGFMARPVIGGVFSLLVLKPRHVAAQP